MPGAVNKVDSTSADVVRPAKQDSAFAQQKCGLRKATTFGGQLKVTTCDQKIALGCQMDIEEHDINASPIASDAAFTKQSSEAYPGSSSTAQSVRQALLSFGLSSNQPSVCHPEGSNLNFSKQVSMEDHLRNKSPFEFQKRSCSPAIVRQGQDIMFHPGAPDRILNDTENVNPQLARGLKVHSGNAIFTSSGCAKKSRPGIQKSQGSEKRRISHASIGSQGAISKKKRLGLASSSSHKAELLVAEKRSTTSQSTVFKLIQRKTKLNGTTKLASHSSQESGKARC